MLSSRLLIFVICAVNIALSGIRYKPKDPSALPTDLLFKRLEEIPTLWALIYWGKTDAVASFGKKLCGTTTKVRP